MNISKMFKSVLAGAVLSIAVSTNASAVSFSGSNLDADWSDVKTFTLAGPSFYTLALSGIEGLFSLKLIGTGPVISEDLEITDSVLKTGTLVAGKYKFSLLVTDSDSGAYSFVTSPVPEASTLGMMVAGLGMMGFVAVRRREDV